MSELPPYPPIEIQPTTFDLIVVGTGLPNSIIAAAASAIGKTVLHLDPNPFYGSHFASLSLSDISSFLNSYSTIPYSLPSTPSNDHDHNIVELTTKSLYSNIEISNYAPQVLEEHSRKFNLDLAGPRVLFCADKAVDYILKSNANHYIDFKPIDASFMCDEGGKLVNVPHSREAIFGTKGVELEEKYWLGWFFNFVQQYLASNDGGDESGENRKISEEDLESPFVEFLNKLKLPPKITWIILYAISMADYDQENAEVCKDVLKTKDGIDRLALYSSSIGRFPNALGAFIYPIFGQGELPQVFCRRAAVKGCLYVLRMPVIALLMNKDSGHYKGVRLASGQDLCSHQLVLDPSITVSLPLAASHPDPLHKSLQVFSLRDVKGKVARGICITRSSLKPDMLNFLVIYPPRSLYPEQVTSIRALQIGGSLAVCPSGMFVLYLSALCDDDDQGKKLIHAAMNALLTLPVSGTLESSFADQSENREEVKPALLWNALYIQELTRGHSESMSVTPMPDGNLNYNDLLDATLKIFKEMYPDEEFFPETTSYENPDDNGGLNLES